MITPTKTILPIALVAALLGGSVGAFVMRPKTTETAETTAATTPLKAVDSAQTQFASTGAADGGGNLTNEQAAYRDGFQEGFLAAQNGTSNDAIYSTTQNRSSNVVPVQYRTSRRVARNGSSRQVYYDYNQRQPQKRSFWQKHRDKLTVAAGTGGGALLGGLIGGKKGALIGALAGAGGSALYTYKIRKKDRRY